MCPQHGCEGSSAGAGRDAPAGAVGCDMVYSMTTKAAAWDAVLDAKLTWDACVAANDAAWDACVAANEANDDEARTAALAAFSATGEAVSAAALAVEEAQAQAKLETILDTP
jgi:hypothetical protein